MGYRTEIVGDHPNGEWKIMVYDDDTNNIISIEDSDGSWGKYEYNQNGNRIYYENSNGHWTKYNTNGNIIDHGYKDLFPSPEQIKEYNNKPKISGAGAVLKLPSRIKELIYKN